MITKAQQRLQAKYGTFDEEKIVQMHMGGQRKKMPSTKSANVRLSAADCQALCMTSGLEYLEGYEARVIEYTLSDERVDRDGDILIQDGADLENFKANPVCLLFHDSRSFPVGNCIKIWVDQSEKALKGWMLFLDDRVDTSGMSERAFRYAKSRAMRAGSVGFQGREVKFPTLEERKLVGMKDWGVIFTAWELMEFTFCPVPSNPGAISEALRKGMLTADDLQFIETEKPEDEVLDMKREELDAIIKDGISKAITEAGAVVKAGKPISAANHTKLMDLHGKMEAVHKDYKAAHKAIMTEMKAFIDSHAPAADTDDDGDTDANPTDGDKPKKSAEELKKAAEDAELADLALVFKAS